MAADHIIDILSPLPGIQRDGTEFDSRGMCIDGQWVRFYEGRPKKIGGYVLLDPGNNEIIRNIYNVDKSNDITDCYLGRPSTLAVAPVSAGIANPEFDRTPVGFVADPNNNWTFDRYTILSESVSLGNDPIATTNGSGVVVVTVPSTVGLSTGEVITISGAVDTNGITAAQLNINASITVLTLTTFSYVSGGIATSTGSGGGTFVSYSTVSPTNYIIAHAAPNVMDINNSVSRLIYWGDVDVTTPLTPISISNPVASGGIVVLYPYFFFYTNDGVVGWTLNPGGDWTDLRVASITGTKIVKGLISRGGSNAPAGLFWSLDSLIKATFIGGDEQFRFDTIQADLSILSQNCIVTVNNVFYWIGRTQFYLYNGVVKQIKNTTNKLMFFKNLNLPYRNKVWGEYKEEYNEIWWHYPSGDNTECSHVIIYNIEGDFWFDTEYARSAGTTIGYEFPMATDSIAILNKFTPTSTISVDLANNPLSTSTGSNVIIVTIPSNTQLQNGNLVTISGATGFSGLSPAQLNQASVPIIVISNISFSYIAGGNATGNDVGGGNAVSYSYLVPNLCYGLWQEETGLDRVLYGQSLAIDSYVDTNITTWFEKAPTDDRQLRNRRIEPDFVQKGEMSMIIYTRDFAQSIPTPSQTYPFFPGQETIELAKIDTTNMGRLVNYRFRSNVSGGDYLMGKVIRNYAPGDVRP